MVVISPSSVRPTLFGSAGEHYLRLAHGRDDRPVVPDREAKSISNETTFAADIDDPEDGLYTLSVSASDAARRVVHLRSPRREFADGRPNPDIAAWERVGLVREWSPAAFQAALGTLPPSERSPDRAMLCALGLFLLGLLLDRR